MSRAHEEAARSAKVAHDAKVTSGIELTAARVRLLTAVLRACAPGLDALAFWADLFALRVIAVSLASRRLAAASRRRQWLWLTSPTSVSDLSSAQLCVVDCDEEEVEPGRPFGRAIEWRPVTHAEAVQLFGEDRGVERLAAELLHRLKRAAEGNNLRRAREWSGKAARLEAIALLVEHESRSAK